MFSPSNIAVSCSRLMACWTEHAATIRMMLWCSSVVDVHWHSVQEVETTREHLTRLVGSAEQGRISSSIYPKTSGASWGLLTTNDLPFTLEISEPSCERKKLWVKGHVVVTKKLHY